MKNPIHIHALWACIALAGTASAQATFEVIEGDVIQCNFDGSILLGVDNTNYFVLENGVKAYIPGSLGCTDLSDDGTIVFGQAPNGSLPSAAIYTAGTGWTPLGGLPGQMSQANADSIACEISGDGSTAVGLGFRTDFRGRGFRWRAANGMQEMPQLGMFDSKATTVSGDGKWIGGFDETMFNQRRAALWDENFNETLILLGVTTDGVGEVNDLNSNGSVACGAAGDEGFVWTPGGGAVTFGQLQNFSTNRAFATSEDGKVVVGNASSPPFVTGVASIWTPTDGLRDLQDVLVASGATGINPTATLEFALAISEDGQTIVGRGFDSTIGVFGFRAFLPRDPTTESFCSSTPNSTGGPAVIGSNDMTSIAANGFVIEADSVPNDTGLFFYSLGQAAGGSGLPFGNGLLCVGGGEPIIRLDPQAAAGNAASQALDFANLPVNSPPALVGEIWSFQYWFRDPGVGAGFDTSGGLAVTWCP